jgi:hypothetical protein
VLLTEDVGIEGNGDIHLVMVARLDTQAVTVLRDIFYRFSHHEDLLLRLLLLPSDTLNLPNEETCGAVQSRHLGTVNLDDAVIHSESVEGT